MAFMDKLKGVKEGFEYNSKNNSHYLKLSEIIKLNKQYLNNQ